MPDFFNPNRFNPLQFGLDPSLQSDVNAPSTMMAPVQDEDPNSPEAFRKRLMQEIANRQQQQQPQDVQAILMDLLNKRRNPEEEARLRQLRAERPEDIQRRMNESMFGKPATSTLGKIGQGILQTAAGAFGVIPDTRKQALEQYKAQQAAAASEESIDQRMTAAQAQAIGAMQRTQQQAQAAEEKNKVAMFGKLMDDLAKERQAKIAALDVNSKIDLRTKQAMKLQLDMDLAEKYGTIRELGKLQGGFQLQQIESVLGKDAAQRVAQADEAIQSVKNSSKNKDAQSVPTTSPIIVQDPTTGTTLNLGMKTSVRTTPAVKAGDENALTKMYGLPSRIPETQPPAPQAAGVPQAQVMAPQQPRIAPRPPVAPQAGIAGVTSQTPQGQFEQVGSGGPATPFAQSLDAQYRGKKYRVGDIGEAYAVPNNWEAILPGAPANGPKVTPSQAAEKLAAKQSLGEITSLNSFMEDAAKKGVLQKLLNSPRGYINAFGGDKAKDLTAAMARWGMDPDIAEAQGRYEMLHSSALTRKIFAQSGKASSEKEARRFDLQLPNDATPYDVNLSKSFYGAVMGPALGNLLETGVIGGDRTDAVATAAQSEFNKRRDVYLKIVKSIAARGGAENAQDTAALKQLKDVGTFRTNVLQSAFPQYQGKDLVIDDPDQRRKIHVYIPLKDNDKEARGTKAMSLKERLKKDPAYQQVRRNAGLPPEED